MRFRKRDVDLDKEIRYHFDRMIRESIAAGMSPGEARRQAQLEFGGLEQTKEDCRDVQGRWLEDFAKDLRYAARALRRKPGFLLVSVISLALGIGANTAIFTLINAVMLRSLPVPEPQRLVRIARLGSDEKPRALSYPIFLYLRDRVQSLSEIEAETSSEHTIVVDGVEELVSGEKVSGRHFPAVAIQPAAGRLLEPADDESSVNSPAAVISYRYWQRRFNGSASALGKTFSIRDRVFTIVGVTPAGYEGTRPGRNPDITVPLTVTMSAEQLTEPTNNMLAVLGRLKPGVSVRQADAEVRVLWKNYLETQTAALAAKDRRIAFATQLTVLRAADGFNPMRIDYSLPLLVLMGIAGLVLLLACANMAGLLLARAASRQREISIRLAIGAGSGRLLRQFLTESVVLAVPGGVAGLLVAFWLSGGLVTMLSNGADLQLSVTPDWRVLSFTAAITLLACLLAGLAPGLHALRVNLNPSMSPSSAAHLRLGKVLVVGQISISMVLLVGATLFIGSLVKLYRVDRGVETNGVLMFSVRANERYSQDRAWGLQSAVLDRLATLPGVTSVTASQVVPLSGGLWTRGVSVEGAPTGPGENEDVGFNVIAPKYFSTLGTPLLGGRDFNSRDSNTAPKVAIVNESFARHYFGPASPLGRRAISVRVTYEIVGVVKDAKYQDLRTGVMPTMYIPWLQREGDQPSNYSFLLRVPSGDPLRLTSSLEALLNQTDSNLRLRPPQLYSDMLDHSIMIERLMATLGGLFGMLAMMVASLGIFGVMAFQVSRRLNELGLRMALGASRGGIIALIVREVAAMFAIGSILGVIASLALTGFARKILFGFTPTEPGIFGLAALILGVTAFVAGWLPALRASRVDPMIALRHD